MHLEKVLLKGTSVLGQTAPHLSSRGAQNFTSWLTQRMKFIISSSLSQNLLHTLKEMFFFCCQHDFFSLQQGFEPALLVFQPLVPGHDVPLSAVAIHNECHQLLCFPTLLESCKEIIFLGLVWGPPQPCALG